VSTESSGYVRGEPSGAVGAVRATFRAAEPPAGASPGEQVDAPVAASRAEVARSGDGAGGRFRHDGLFWRRLAHWGSTRAPVWLRRIGPPIVGALAFALLRENRRNAIANLRCRRGSRATRGAIGDAAEVLRLFVEFAYCVSEAFEFSTPNGRPVEIESPAGFDPHSVLGAGRGLVVLTSHFGTWEIGARAMQQLGPRVNVVMAREANPSVDDFQRGVREGGGLRILHSDSSVFSSINMVHALRRGEVVALQLDRGAPGQVTRRIEFFGRPAPFQYGPFALARLAGVPIWPVFVARTAPRSYRFLPEPLRTIARDASEADTLAVMADVVGSFERRVREYPRQWFQFRRFWDDGETAAETSSV
jgi:lauroyl/myristoyl acyltransferase